MKRTLQGRQYDTAKARALAQWNEGYAVGSRCYCEETLYRTRSGLYFLHGVGGPESRHADSGRGRPTTSGESVTPLAIGAAAEWVRAHPARLNYDSMAVRRLLEPDHPVTAVKPEPLLIMVPAPMKDLIRAEASRRQVSVTTIVLEAVGKYLA